jgi:uncharacterized membrane protein
VSTAPPRTQVPYGRLRIRSAALATDQKSTLVVVGAMAGWAVLLFLVARDRYAHFRYARYDLGNMVQAVWSTAHGRLLESTNGFTGEQTSRLASHFDPILAAVAPLWMVAPSPLTLEALQISLVALGALPVYWLGQRHLESHRAATLLAIAYLACPWIGWNALDALHPVTLAIPLFLFCIWFLENDRLVPFAICGALVLITGELMGLFLAGVGVWCAFSLGRRLVGIVTVLVGVGWTSLILLVVIPQFSGSDSAFYGAYDKVGGSPAGIVKTAVTDPVAVLSAVTEQRDFVYVLLLALPTAGVFVLAPPVAALALPQLAVNVLADVPGTTDPHEHYGAAILPFLFAATAIGLGRLSSRGRERGALLVATAAIAACLTVGPWPGSFLGAAAWDPLNTSPQYVQALDHAVSLVPDGAPVTSTNRVGSRLAERRYFYSAPVIGRAEWAVIEVSDTWIPTAYTGESQPARLHAFLARLEHSPHWEKVSEESGIVVYRRTER